MKVLLTTDGSPCSTHALRVVWPMLESGPHAVQLLAVAEILPLMGAYEGMGVGMADFIEEQITAVRTQTEQARKDLDALGVAAEAIVLTGDPAGMILEQANTFKPDVIVMGAHGRGFIERALLGSVSTHILHHWGGNTLIIHPPATEPQPQTQSITEID